MRRGYDSEEKLDFANERKEIASRVQLHRFYAERLAVFEFDDEDDT